jgi:hypothetical protein
LTYQIAFFGEYTKNGGLCKEQIWAMRGRFDYR